MVSQAIAFPSVRPSDVWNTDILPVKHNLGDSPLFTDEALAELVSANPDAIREVATMDVEREDLKAWKNGSVSSIDPATLLDAVRSGTLWINLGDVGARDQRYQAVIDELLEGVEAEMPGLETFRRKIGILISSPNARVYYHADIPGQGLMHIRGTKKIWIYPGEEPYLQRDELEGVVTKLTAEEITYRPQFDDAATCVELHPGDGALWPLNWPHRVQNGNSLNVSATIEYWTSDIRRTYAMNYANGVMRQVFGMNPKSRATSGTGFWAKAAFAAAWKMSGLNERYQHKFKNEFTLDEATATR